MSGRITLGMWVSSYTSSTPVSGACAVAATIAAMPTSAHCDGSGALANPAACSPSPNAPPVSAPISRLGANMPPEPPEPSVRHVATAFTKPANSSDTATLAITMGVSASAGPYSEPASRLRVSWYPAPKKGGSNSPNGRRQK